MVALVNGTACCFGFDMDLRLMVWLRLGELLWMCVMVGLNVVRIIVY